VLTLAGADGRVRHRTPLGLAAGTTAYPLGSGFLVGAASGSTLYR
jgi:hypothetical protein